MYPEIDISGWPSAEEEFLGTKPKHWVQDPADGAYWLWKESTSNDDKVRGPFRKGDDWAEKVACEVARDLGIPAAEVELARLDDRFGVVIRRLVNDDETLIHGNELLAEVADIGDDPRDRTGYTLDAVQLTLDGVLPPRAAVGLTDAMDWFALYLVLDALLGNTDRHQENWGVIRSTGATTLCPSFDHASSLGFMLHDDVRDELVSGTAGRTVATYSRRATTKFQGAPSPCEAAVQALDLATTDARARAATVVASRTSIDDLVAQFPPDRMSESAGALARALYAENHAALSHHLRTMVT